MPPNKPKQRVLVRWNDDLDKSLLLFITYTCSDMGIKIPYDEVARRMGSTFSEGAIVQHISKLRSKMAEIGTTLVPPATKRGTITTKPSSVYAQKSRTAPPPPSSGKNKPKARATAQASDDDFIDDDEEIRASASQRRKPARKRNTYHKARNNSLDEDNSDDDFDTSSDGGHNRPKKRLRTVHRGGKNIEKAADIIANLEQADAEYERSLATTKGGSSEEMNVDLPILGKSESSVDLGRRTRGVRPNYALPQEVVPDDDEEEEEEEEEEGEEEERHVLPMKSKYDNQLGTTSGHDQSLDGQESPRSALPYLSSGGIRPSSLTPANARPVMQSFDDILPNSFAHIPSGLSQPSTSGYDFGVSFLDQFAGQQNMINSDFNNPISYPSSWLQDYSTPSNSQTSRNHSTISNSSSFLDMYQDTWNFNTQPGQVIFPSSDLVVPDTKFDDFSLPQDLAAYSFENSTSRAQQDPETLFFNQRDG